MWEILFTICDAVIFICGVLAIIGAIQMVKTGRPGRLLVTEQQMGEIKDMDGFIKSITPTLVVQGVAGIAYGVVGGISDLVYDLGFAKQGILIVFVITILTFSSKLQKAKKEYQDKK